MELLDNFYKNAIENKTVLDLGFSGYNSEFGKRSKILVDYSKKWYGGDNNKKFLAKHEKHYNNIFFCDLNSPNFFNNLPKNVDIITLIEVVEHLHSPYHTIQQICKNKDKNTEILISVPNGLSFGRVLFGITNRNLLLKQDIKHYYAFNEQTLNNIFTEMGLKKFTIKPYVRNRKLKFLLSLFPNLASGFLVYGK